ncbi:MAG TPA: carboxypeptidase-like regulatory domain-containing protein [Candidatus Baltobacteraceae bacterium]
MAFARTLLVAAALAVGLAACNTDDLPPAAQYGSLSGIVLDRASSKPIAGAVVTVDAILSVTTDADGKFSIARVPSGDYDYTVTAQGYSPLSSSARADAGKAATLSLQLDAQTPGASPAAKRRTYRS